MLQCMVECNSPWLVNLVSTARDDKNIYMLLEAVMGGELFAYLQVCVVHEHSPHNYYLAAQRG